MYEACEQPDFLIQELSPTLLDKGLCVLSKPCFSEKNTNPSNNRNCNYVNPNVNPVFTITLGSCEFNQNFSLPTKPSASSTLLFNDYSIPPEMHFPILMPDSMCLGLNKHITCSFMLDIRGRFLGFLSSWFKYHSWRNVFVLYHQEIEVPLKGSSG